jgi:hypothetical protein
MYSLKRVRVDKATMNSATNKATTSSTTNKAKRKAFVENLNKHIDAGNRIVFQDETSFNLYLSRTTGWSRVGERAVVALPPPQKTHSHPGWRFARHGYCPSSNTRRFRQEGRKHSLSCDLFMATLRTDEF